MKKKLLLIEDDEVIVFLTKKLIRESDGVELMQVLTNGEKALGYFRKYASDADLLPDIVFLDLSMPVLDGWQFLELYNELKGTLVKPIQVYITTSSISPNDIKKADTYNFVTDFIVKPISIENFRKIISG